MATSTGKTILLVVLIIFLVAFFLQVIPFLFGIFRIWPSLFKLGIPRFGVGIPGSIGIFFSTILLIILWLIVTIWVYRDAEHRGMNGLLWGLLVFVGNIIGFLVYLIVRSEGLAVVQNHNEPCPGCGKPVNSKFSYCPYCGTKIKATCQECGKIVGNDWKACPYCGNMLEKNKNIT